MLLLRFKYRDRNRAQKVVKATDKVKWKLKRWDANLNGRFTREDWLKAKGVKKKKKKKSEWKSSGKWQHWKIQTLWSAEEPQPSTQEPAEPSSVWRGPAWQWASLTCSWKALLLTWRPGQATQLLNIEGKMRCGKWQNLLDGWVKKFQIFGQQGVTVSLTDPQYNTF